MKKKQEQQPEQCCCPHCGHCSKQTTFIYPWWQQVYYPAPYPVYQPWYQPATVTTWSTSGNGLNQYSAQGTALLQSYANQFGRMFTADAAVEPPRTFEPEDYPLHG